MASKKFGCKNVDMLLTSRTILGSLQNNQEKLVTVRTNWTPEYITNLIAKVDDGLENKLGLDKKKDLKNATKELAALHEPAKKDLSFLKAQIGFDFENKDEVYKTLGFDKHYTQAYRGNQQNLIQMLYTFKLGMTDELRQSFIDNGTNVEVIDRIISYADRVKEVNAQQELLKETTKELSAEVIEYFNEIYTEIQGICKIASNYFREDQLKKEQFTFSKVLGNMRNTSSSKKEEIEETQNAETID